MDNTKSTDTMNINVKLNLVNRVSKEVDRLRGLSNLAALAAVIERSYDELATDYLKTLLETITELADAALWEADKIENELFDAARARGASHDEP